MSKFTLIEYNNSYYDKWNEFIESSNNGNIFHRLDFLAYHGDKFKNNENHLIWLKGEHIFAVMPMAVFDIDGKKIAKSPYGASFGGIVTRDVVNYKDSNELVSSLIDYIKENNIDELIITPSTTILNKINSETLNFCYLENRFKLVNADITSIIDLTNNFYESKEKEIKRKYKKLLNNDFDITVSDDINLFWKVMEITFAKHGVNTTHNKLEWSLLSDKFKSIKNKTLLLNNTPIAGLGLIEMNEVLLTFYICSDYEYNNYQPLTYLIKKIIDSNQKQFKYIDFGTSSVQMIANENIFRFKESFGSIGLFRHTLKFENK